MANFKWRAADGRFDVAANWANTTLRINPARVAPGAGDNVVFDTGGGTISGAGDVFVLSVTGASGSSWNIVARLTAETSAILGATTIAAGGLLDGGVVTLGISAPMIVSSSGTLNASGLTLLAGSELTVAADGLAVIGTGLRVPGSVTVNPSSTLAVHSGSVRAAVVDDGQVVSDGLTVVAGNLTGTGGLTVGSGLVQVQGVLGVAAITFDGASAILRAQALQGQSAVSGFGSGDVIDVLDGTGFTFSQNDTGASLTVSGGTLELAQAPAGSRYGAYGDAHGGTQLLLDSPPPADALALTDTVTGLSSTDVGQSYSGPVDYLQRQFILAGEDATAVRANVPNVFLKGGAGNDALQVSGGNNVLDGGTGSNFLIGHMGADGGRDTFFLDGRSQSVTWSTIVNFRSGDFATVFGYHDGSSSRTDVGSDGVPGFTGLTLHMELAGPGTGVSASLTFAEISPETASAHFSTTTGTLSPNTSEATDYLLIEYRP